VAAFRYAQVAADLPDGWEARGFSRQEDGSGEQTYAVLHVANFPLPPVVGDYGGGAVETMRPGDVFISLLEFGPESAGSPLFASTTVPQLRHDDFDTNLLQRGIPGQSGAQRFFTVAGRPYSLYVVLGEHLLRLRTTPAINDVLRGIHPS